MYWLVCQGWQAGRQHRLLGGIKLASFYDLLFTHDLNAEISFIALLMFFLLSIWVSGPLTSRVSPAHFSRSNRPQP